MSKADHKCVVYARVSSKEQEEEGFSIDAQKKLLWEYARVRAFNVIETFEDVETAKHSGRAAFNRMVSLLKSDQSIRIILVEKTDRLYRNFVDYTLLLSLNVEIHLVKENKVIEKDSVAYDIFFHHINLAVANFYVNNLSEEVKKGLQEKADQGHYPGRASIGYRNVRQEKMHVIEPDPEPAYLVLKLFQWYATGQYSLKTVSEKVYQEGLGYRKSGRKFSAGTVEKILKNPIYYGWFRWKGKLREGRHKAIVSKELFDQVQTQLKRFDKPRKAKLSFAFRGLLTCGYCGCQMTAQRQGKSYIYYNCTGARGKCPQRYIREEHIAQKLGDVIKAITFDASIVEWIRQALKSNHADEQDFHKRAVTELKRELSRLENRLAAVYEDKLDGFIDNDTWRKYHDRYRSEIAEVKHRLDRHLNANLDYYEEGVRILEIAQSAYSQYIRQNNQEKRRLLDCVVSKCSVKGDEIIPKYRKPFDLLAVKKIEVEEEKSGSGENPPDHQLWLGDRDSTTGILANSMKRTRVRLMQGYYKG